MEPISTMILAGCYKPSVNESETITEAQPICSLPGRGGANGFRAPGLFPVPPLIERS